MEVLEYHIPYSRSDVFYFYPIGDIHAGSIQCAEDKITSQISQIARMENAYIIGMGDYADCILKDDVRFDIAGLAPWVQKDNILRSQSDWLKNLFTPVKDKIICLLSGNHEEKIRRNYQDHFVLNLCSDLGCKYAGYQAFLNLIFDREGSNESHRYIFHIWHGAGAAQSDGAVTNRLMLLVNEIYAHVYLMGHLHRIKAESPHRLECRGNKVKDVQLIAACTGSWLKGYAQSTDDQPIPPSYVELKGYKPSRLGCPVILIAPDKDKVEVIV